MKRCPLRYRENTGRVEEIQWGYKAVAENLKDVSPDVAETGRSYLG